MKLIARLLILYFLLQLCTVYAEEIGSDYEVGITVNIAKCNGDTAGVIFRKQNDKLYDTAYYMAVVTYVQPNVIFKLRKRIKTSYYDLYTKTLASSGIHKIDVCTDANKITVRLDESEQYEFEDYGYNGSSYIGHPLLSGGAEGFLTSSEGKSSCYDFYINPKIRTDEKIISDSAIVSSSGDVIENFVPVGSEVTVNTIFSEPVSGELILGMYSGDRYIGGETVELNGEDAASATLPEPTGGDYAYVKAYIWNSMEGMVPEHESQEIGAVNNYIRDETIDEKEIEPDFSENLFFHSNGELTALISKSKDETAGIAIDTGLSSSEIYGKDVYVCALKNRELVLYHLCRNKKEIVASADAPLNADGYYTMKINLKGADIRVSIDGTEYIRGTARNLFYMNGKVGKYTDGDNCYVQNIKIN